MEENKTMLPAIKVYDIDYEFIIKNYTDPKLWDKKWTLFVFKNYVFQLSLYSIDVRAKQIVFEIELSSDLDIYYNQKKDTFRYDLQNMSIDFLKKLITDKMERLINSLEIEYIEARDDDYLNVEEIIRDERETLSEIANNFLDENDVYNSEIREVYIDYYVDQNGQAYSYRNRIVDNKRYKYLTDLYLIFAEVTKDNELKNNVIINQDKDISNIINEIEEFKEYLESDEYSYEMQDKLESI